MRIIKLDLIGDSNKAVSNAVEALKHGGVVVLPTDTIYGLCANACDGHAVRQIFRIKQRDPKKGLPILVRNIAWAREVAFIPPKLEESLDKLWPGPITIILPKKKIIPSEVSGGTNTVAIRIPDSKLIDSILGKFGYPITATSANISGEEGADDPVSFVGQFSNQIWKPDIILDAGKLNKSQPSTIIDFSKLKPKIVRIGPVKPNQLEKILGIKIN